MCPEMRGVFELPLPRATLLSATLLRRCRPSPATPILVFTILDVQAAEFARLPILMLLPKPKTTMAARMSVAQHIYSAYNCLKAVATSGAP